MARKILFTLLALLVIVAVTPYLLGDMEPVSLDDEHRKAAPGQFVGDSGRQTHYESVGPADAQPVVLIHGIGSWLYVWDPLVPELTSSGFRVIRYDMFGRGYSDRPNHRYDADFFDRQLLDLLQALDIKVPVDLVGWSAGGAISANFAARHPDKVRKLVMLAPAGAPRERSAWFHVMLMPAIGEWLARSRSDAKILAAVPGQLYRPDSPGLFVERFAEQLEFKGYRRAYLSTLRNYSIRDLSESHQAIAKAGIPTLVIWGEDDVSLPVKDADYFRTAIPNSEVHVLDHAGHTVHYEDAQRVAPILRSFLK